MIFEALARMELSKGSVLTEIVIITDHSFINIKPWPMLRFSNKVIVKVNSHKFWVVCRGF